MNSAHRPSLEGGPSHGDVQGTPTAEMAVDDFMRPVVAATRILFLTSRAAARHRIPRGSGVIERDTMLGRAATLEDVGDVAAVVASDRARTMTAATANISSGALID